ncbi:MAG: hypothetical protein ACODAE_10195, partial [Gemmatimonadota bacterium]
HHPDEARGPAATPGQEVIEMENNGQTRYTPEGPTPTPRERGERRGGGGMSERAGEARERVQRLGSRVKRRTRRAVDERRPQMAGRMDRLGRRLRERGRSLQAQGGVKARAGQAVSRVGQGMERGADYVRTHNAGEMRSDAELRVRERPLTSLAVALGAGLLLGRILR